MMEAETIVNSRVNKMVGSFLCETSDWSMFMVAEALNTILAKQTEKVLFDSCQFEYQGTEYQLLIVSIEKLTAKDRAAIVRHFKHQLKEG